MDKTQALQLRDIHLPADPSIWPLAPGWWLLIIIFIALGYFLIKKIIKVRHKKHLINMMQDKLQQLREDYNKHKNKHRLAIEISELLKRFVRHVLIDSNASSLTGDEWLNYLNNLAEPDVFTEFRQELTQAQYSPNIDYDVPKLMATVKNFFAKALNARDKKTSSKMIKGVKNA